MSKTKTLALLPRAYIATLGMIGAVLIGAAILFAPRDVAEAASLYYTFNSPGTLYEAGTVTGSTSSYLWLKSGAKLIIQDGIGMTIQGALPSTDPWFKTYATRATVTSDGGTHPQNAFVMYMKNSAQNVSAQIDVKRVKDNLTNPANRHPYNGESILLRYKDANNYYYGGVRADGNVVIKKKTNGVYRTLVMKKIFSGTYSAVSNPDLIPFNQWIGLKMVVADGATGPTLSLYTDVGKTGTWKLVATAVDDPAKFGSSISGVGLVGIQSDYADAQFDNFIFSDAGTVPAPTPTPTPTPTPSPSTGYDSTVLSGNPVMYLTMSSPGSGSESDKSGHGNNGAYKGGSPTTATLPNGDTAADFNGSSQYLTVPSNSAMSIPTTKTLTWEAWIRPDTFSFPNASGDGYVDWMGKCQDYSPTCEWEARIYSTVNPEGRPNRLSAYVFNPSAGLGSGADWQPESTNVLKAGQWIHVVAEYQTQSTPSGCSSAYPGTINIWVNGIKQSFANHVPTGCMSQYNISPKAGSSPLNIGTMAMDTWFKGAVGKVAIYNRLLSQTEIDSHFKAMTGKSPSGSCAETCTTVPVQ